MVAGSSDWKLHVTNPFDGFNLPLTATRRFVAGRRSTVVEKLVWKGGGVISWQAGISFGYKKRAVAKNSPKNSAARQGSVLGAVTKSLTANIRNLKHLRDLACTVSPSSSTVFSHFVLPAFGLSPRWRQGQKQPELSKNIPKTVVKPPRSSLGASPG